MNGRILAERLLATTSVAALALAFIAPDAEARCANPVPAAGSYVNTGTVGCIAVTTSAVSVTNAASGTVGPSRGFIVVNSGATLSGGIVNAGHIVNTGSSSSALAIIVAGGLVQGGITNSGTISTSAIAGGSTTAIAMGLSIFGSSGFGSAAASFGGNISNSGTITAIANGTSAATAIGIGLRVSAFSGSIVNSGTISASANAGFAIATGITASVASFSGGITNNGTITGSATDAGGEAIARGIAVQGTSGGIFLFSSTGFVTSAATSFGGSIVNSGTISLSATGFRAGIVGLYADVSTFSGGLTNSGSISVSANSTRFAYADGIDLGVIVLGGDVSNGGTITVTADPPGGIAIGHGIIVHGTSGNFSTASSFGGSVVNSGSVVLTVTGNHVATATGISLRVGTFAGNVVNSGTILVAGAATSTGFAEVFADGIALFSGTYLGGVTNIGSMNVSGTASSGSGVAHATGILLCDCVGPFSGGIVNGGTIVVNAAGGRTGVAAAISANSSTFSGGITSSGTISATASGVAFARAVGIGLGLETSGSSFSVASFAGNVSNNGTVVASATANGATGTAQATGIAIGVSTFSGGIVNAGNITAAATASGTTSVLAVGIAAGHTVFAGGVTNSGTIIASATNLATAVSNIVAASGVRIAGFTFGGTVTNSGQIQATASVAGSGQANAWGLFIDARTSFNGGITNSGSIIARSGGPAASGQATGLFIGSSHFTGNIVNSGTIAGSITGGSGTGRGVRFFCGAAISLTNSGTITGSTWGVDASQGNGATINQTGGLISGGTGASGGAILLSSNADTLNISGGAIAGNIQGGGAANIVNVAMGAGTFSYAGQITNVGTVNLTSGTLLLQNLNAPGVKTVNYNQSSAATLALEISPAATLNHASVSASGTISVAAGGVLQMFAGPFAWTPGNYTYSDLITAASINGSFVVTTNSPFFVASLSQPITQNCACALSFSQPASLTMSVTMLSPSQVPGLTANQQSVANAIIGIPGGNAVLDQLFTLTNPGPALTQLSAEQFTQTNYQPLIQAWQMFSDSLSDRLSQGAGYGGTVSASYEPGQGLQFSQANIPQTAQMSDAAHGVAPSAPHQWGLWARGYGLSSTAPSTTASLPYSEAGAGLIVGADNQITERIVAGVALNVSTDKATVTGGSGYTQTNAYQGSAYGQYAIDRNWYVNGMAGFGWQTYKTSRLVTLLAPGVDNGTFDGQSYRLYGETGYALHPAFAPQTRVTPYLGLGYLHVHTDGFTETGGSTSALSVQATDPNSVTTTLGARAVATFQVGGTSFRPELRVAWQHEFLDQAATMRAAFATVPGSPVFTATGTGFGRESFLGGAGMTTTITSSTQVFFDYDAKVNGGYTAQAVSGGLRVQF